jgi:hypothetical protein
MAWWIATVGVILLVNFAEFRRLVVRLLVRLVWSSDEAASSKSEIPMLGGTVESAELSLDANAASGNTDSRDKFGGEAIPNSSETSKSVRFIKRSLSRIEEKHIDGDGVDKRSEDNDSMKRSTHSSRSAHSRVSFAAVVETIPKRSSTPIVSKLPAPRKRDTFSLDSIQSTKSSQIHSKGSADVSQSSMEYGRRRTRQDDEFESTTSDDDRENKDYHVLSPSLASELKPNRRDLSQRLRSRLLQGPKRTIPGLAEPVSQLQDSQSVIDSSIATSTDAFLGPQFPPLTPVFETSGSPMETPTTPTPKSSNSRARA